MWDSLVRLALGLAFAFKLASSGNVVSRQEQCASATSDAEKGACDMQAAFGGSSIIPKLLPVFSPTAALSVKYDNVVIGGAQQMSPSKVATQPFLSLAFISSNPQVLKQAYIILALEYQPQSQAVRPFWLQSSVKIEGSTGGMSSSIAPVVKYRSPNPPQASGTNEYIFLVFRDPGMEGLIKQNPQLVATILGSFDFQDFLTTFKLSNNLVAGSFFKSTFDGIPINSQSLSASPVPQGQQVPQSAPVTSRVSNESTIAKPEAITQTQSKNIPTQTLQSSSAADTVSVTPVQRVSQPVSAFNQTNGADQAVTGQNGTSSAIINLASQKYSTSLMVVIAFGASFL